MLALQSYRSRTQTQTLFSWSSELGVGKGTLLGVSVAAGLQPGQRRDCCAPRRPEKGAERVATWIPDPGGPREVLPEPNPEE